MKYIVFTLLLPFIGISQTLDTLPPSQKDSLPLPSTIEGETKAYRISKDEILIYKKPKISDIFNKIPRNFGKSATLMVSKPYYPYGLASLAATVAIIPADPWLIEESRNFGKNLGLNEAHTYKKLGFLKIIPADVNSAMYFIGNGTTFLIISGGLATYGLITNNYRAKSVSMQLVESIIVSGLFVQPFKRLSGRESPFITFDEGRRHSHWTFAPSFAAYQRDTPNYDAMPSGHLTTAMSALTVLIENYPDHKWIKPVGYTALGLMAFEMMQSKVHWASDYPIALFVGYITGKTIAGRRITRQKINEGIEHPTNRYTFDLSTSTTLDGYQMVGFNLRF